MKDEKTGHSILECLEHLRGAAGFDASDRERCRVRDRVAELLGISVGTGYRLFTRLTVPTGERLIRLCVFLEFLGYKPAERQGLCAEVKMATKLVAFRLFSPADLALRLGVTTDTALRILTGRNNCLSEHRETLGDIASSVDTDQNVSSWQADIAELGLASIGGTFTPGSDKENNHGYTIDRACALIKELKPLLEEINSDQFTPSERQELRERTGRHGIFDMSNLFFQLCGERARIQVKRGKS